jgi:hypothetical protein
MLFCNAACQASYNQYRYWFINYNQYRYWFINYYQYRYWFINYYQYCYWCTNNQNVRNNGEGTSHREQPRNPQAGG